MFKCWLSYQKYGFGIRDPRSGMRDPENFFPWSRIQGSIRHRIPDPDPQHCIANNSFISTADSGYTERRKKVGWRRYDYQPYWLQQLEPPPQVLTARMTNSHTQCGGSGMFIPDTTFFHPGSNLSPFRIPDTGSASKNLSILTTQKNWFLSSRKYDPACSSRIPGPEADFYPSRIAEP